MKCAICSRPALRESLYCKYHDAANRNLKKHYADWERRYGSLSWERYLESVSQISDSGDWVREVANQELNLSQ